MRSAARFNPLQSACISWALLNVANSTLFFSHSWKKNITHERSTLHYTTKDIILWLCSELKEGVNQSSEQIDLSNFTFSLAQWARPEEYHLPTKYKKSKLQVGLARGKQTLRPTYPKDKPEFYLFSIPGIPNTCKHD